MEPKQCDVPFSVISIDRTSVSHELQIVLELGCSWLDMTPGLDEDIHSVEREETLSYPLTEELKKIKALLDKAGASYFRLVKVI